jgi:hypothetical protein
MEYAMKVKREGNLEIVDLTVIEQVDDILKRLYTIENILLNLTPVIDLAYNYEDRLDKLELEFHQLRRVKMATKVVKNTAKKVSAKVPKNIVKKKMPKPAGLRKARR